MIFEVIEIAQQLPGVNIIFIYSAEIFAIMGSTTASHKTHKISIY
jgi:hypothetical protein